MLRPRYGASLRRLPPKSATPFKPEPALANEDYDHILSVLHDMAIVMECSPSAFRALNEEALRFQFLVPLNGHYEGAASGETFNYEGKTDIIIRVEGPAIGAFHGPASPRISR